MTSSSLVLVTGASRGLGAASARLLAQRGYQVVGTATTPEGAQAIRDMLGEWQGQGVVLNLAAPTVQTDLEDLVRDLDSRGGLYGLVNNAGVTRDGLLLRMSTEQWQQVLDTNLTGTFRLCRAVIKGMMKRRGGRIVNVGSIVGHTGNAGQTNYAASKAGLVAFSKSLAMEVGGRGITVNTVAPGCIDTDMTRALPEDVRAAAIAHTPLGRIGQPNDIAEAVAFLMGPGAGFITGETLHVNGGMHMF